MTCHECELLLAMEKSGADEHLAGCAACRGLAEEMQANTGALRSFAADDLPRVRFAPRRGPRWEWALAVAAMLLLMFGLSRAFRTEQLVLPSVQVAMVPPKFEIPPASVIHKVKHVHKQKAALLKVKMLTSDPDVVIYWLIETKEGTE